MLNIFTYVYIYIYIRHRAPGTKWACLVTERSEFDDVNTQRSMMSTIYDQCCRWWTGQRSFLGPTYPPVDSRPTPLLRPWNHFFGFQLRLQNSSPFQSPKIHPKSSKKLRKPSPTPSQNGSKIACYLTTPEILKKCTPPIRKPTFWRSLAFKNRRQIDAKTPSKSGLSWIPSWNPKKYHFWC